MPVVVHPLIGDQMNWKFLQRLRDNAIECCIVLFLEKDGGLGIATVERVINAAGFIGARRSSYEKTQNKDSI